MNAYKINLIILGSMLVVAALFGIPFLLLGFERFLDLFPFLMIGLSAVTIVIVAVVLYRVFIGGGKKAQTIESGEDAEATIISVVDTGVTLQDGLYFQVKFDMEVRPAMGSSFRTSVKEYVSRVNVARYQPGMVVNVKYNPRNHEEVAIVGAAAGERSEGAGAAVEEPVFASDAAGASTIPAPATGGRSRGKLLVMIGIPLIISIISLAVPLLLMSKQDEIGEYIVEKATGEYEITGATIVDGYMPPEETVFKPDGGNKWVMVTLTVRNTGSRKLDLLETRLKLVTADGSEYTPDIVVDTGNDFEAQDLAPGTTYTGNIVYEVPEGATPAAIRDSFGGDTPL